MKTKWVDIQVTNKLFKEMNAGRISGIELVSEPTTPRMSKPKKSIPYLKVIITGKPSEKHWENPEKVQFPAYCMYISGNGDKQLGVLNAEYHCGRKTYTLHNHQQQWDDVNTVTRMTNLERLMSNYDIEIVKVKIIAKRG